MKYYLRITNTNGSVRYIERAITFSLEGVRIVSGFAITKHKSNVKYFDYDSASIVSKTVSLYYNTLEIEIVGRVKAEGRKI